MGTRRRMGGAGAACRCGLASGLPPRESPPPLLLVAQLLPDASLLSLPLLRLLSGRPSSMARGGRCARELRVGLSAVG